MKNFKALLVMFAWFYLLPYISHAQTITQNEFLNQLIQTHPVFEKEKLTAQIEKEEQNSYMGAQDWNVFSTANLSQENPALAFAGPERISSLNISGGVSRLFWKTGGRLSASVSAGTATIKLPPQIVGFPKTFQQNQIDITYTHPLIRNKYGFLDQLEYRLKQYTIDFSEIQALENQENFLADAAGKFFDWVFITEQQNIVQDRLSLSEEELSNVQRRRDANLVDEVDVIRARDAVRFWTQNLVLVESQWKALQAEMATLTQNNEFYNFSPEFNLYEIKELMPLDEAISEIKENARLVKVLNISIDQLKFYRKGFEEQLKPDLSLVSQFNIKRAEDKILKSFLLNKPDIAIGLQYSFPRENRTAKSKISQTDLQIEQLNKEIESIIITLSSTITNLHIQLQEMAKVLTLNQEQIESAQEKTQEELKLYNQGRSNLTFVIQSRDSEQNAKLNYAQNALTYHKLIVQLMSLMDQLYK